MKKGFTLAEIMIVLSVIAVLTAILLPAAQNAMPNEKVMKFKKGHEIFKNAIAELVMYDKYYLNGDLGIKANNTPIDGTHDGDNTYFCETFADILGDVKEKDCKEVMLSCYGSTQIISELKEQTMRNIDSDCAYLQTNNRILNGEITLANGITFYRTNPDLPFAIIQSDYEYYLDMRFVQMEKLY